MPTPTVEEEKSRGDWCASEYNNLGCSDLQAAPPYIIMHMLYGQLFLLVPFRLHEILRTMAIQSGNLPSSINNIPENPVEYTFSFQSTHGGMQLL